MKKNLKSFMRVLFSNFLILFLGIVQSFILPKMLGPEEYGIWSTYLLYVGYAGLFSFGFCDGLYLEYGGSDYNKLDYSKFSGYYYSHLLFLSVCFLIWCVIVFSWFDNIIFWILVGFTVLLSCNRDFFMAVNSATSRLDIHAKVQPIEKIILVIGILICFFAGVDRAIYVICFAVSGWFITMIVNAFLSKDFVFKYPHHLFKPFSIYRKYVSTGLCLTLSIIGISLLTGVGKFVISWTLGATALGYYSFIFSISALFTQVFNAMSTVFYPLLRNKSRNVAFDSLSMLDKVFTYAGLMLIPFYYPIRIILANLFPQYSIAMDILIVLIPLVIVQGKMDTVFKTMYTVWRMEKNLLKNLVKGVLTCIVLTLIVFAATKSIFAVAVCTYVSLVIWNLITVHDYNKNQSIKWKYDYWEIIYVLVFVLINIFCGFSVKSFVLTILEVSIIFLIKRKQIMILVRNLIQVLKEAV